MESPELRNLLRIPWFKQCSMRSLTSRSHGVTASLVARDDEDRAARAELGDQARGLPRGREANDGGALARVGGGDGRGRDRHRRVGGRRYGVHEVCGHVAVGDGGLGLLADGAHHGDRLEGVVALGGLPREHHAVGAVEHGVGHVAHLGARGARVEGHRLEHLRRTDDRLARAVALCDHHLLRDEDLLRGDLDAEVAARHHDAVRLLEDGVEVAHALVVLDLGDDLDALARGGVGRHQARAHLLHVARLADERGEDHVDALLHAELQVGLVLL
eukprot:scaffold3454_cov68-Phaeocystis_antarctica.AAC.1